jgi:hypothetical protein
MNLGFRPSVALQRETLMKWVKDNSLTIVLLTIFMATLVGQALTGWTSNNQERMDHGRTALSLVGYLQAGEFLSTLFENWESEFLQMSAYVFLTAWLIQRGSGESKDPDARDEEDAAAAATPDALKPRPARAPRGSVARRLYENSLGLALLALFIASFILHWINSARLQGEEAILHGAVPAGLLARLADPAFWFESFQNWQSEFLATGLLVVLSIWLRQKNSPESKPVAAPHRSTGR